MISRLADYTDWKAGAESPDIPAEVVGTRPDRATARRNLDRLGETIGCTQVYGMLESDAGDVFVLDVETTGLDESEDDVLELSIINGSGRMVWDRRYSSRLQDWPGARRIHAIGPEDVEGLPRLDADAPLISAILRRSRVIAGYNTWFDLGFLAHAGVMFPKVPVCDVMADFAPVYGEWSDYFHDFKWQKLTTAGRYYGLDIEGAHGALADCRLTLAVLRGIAENRRRSYDPASNQAVVR